MTTQLRNHSTKRRKKKANSSLAKPSLDEEILARSELDEEDITLCSVCLKEDDSADMDDVEWI